MCRGPVRPPARGRRPVYCSRACQARAYRARKNPPLPEATEPELTGHRRRIVEAVWRIAAERGLQRATIREIAAEADVTPRVVQYHFTGKHHLLITALRTLHRDNGHHSRERIAALRGASDPRVLLRATLEELLPLDEQRRTSLRVMTAYYAWSLTDPSLAAVFLHQEHPLEDLVTALIAAAGARPSIDPAQEANLLVGGISGLGLDLLHRRRTRADVRRTLDHHLNRILAEPGSSATSSIEPGDEPHALVSEALREGAHDGEDVVRKPAVRGDRPPSGPVSYAEQAAEGRAGQIADFDGPVDVS